MKIQEKLEVLRELMRRESIDAFIFPSTDPHNGEYIPAHWESRQWISGFNGSAGTAVVTLHEAALWTDSRYFIAAAEQLKDTEYVLMKDAMPGTPSIQQWLAQKLSASGGTCVGVDGMVMSHADVEAIREELSKCGITMRTNLDPMATLWRDRPAIPEDVANVHPVQYAGEDVDGKIARIREEMKAQRADYLLVTALDDIAWVMNMRGTDVHCNPVFVSYLLIGRDDVTLFVSDRKLDAAARNYLQLHNIIVRAYEDILPSLHDVCHTKSGVNTGVRILADSATTAFTLYDAIRKNVRSGVSPIPQMKTVKNETEVAGFRSAMLKDGIALAKFGRWLDDWKNASVEPDNQPTEISIDRKLWELRSQQPGFRDISFDTIAGYGAHAAIVHYEATPETDIPLERHGLLLIDSGAQYAEGTTDITRTYALGPLTDEERKAYTLVLKGNIQIAMVKFPDGASGTQLDALARMAMWREGINYGHGTGHGVGSYLNVHEGPHQIRMQWKPAPLRANMTVTDEPGIYLEGRCGVRIENTMLITPYIETEFGKFLQMEPLTLCPIDTTPIIRDMMTAEEIDWLNAYHAHVREELLPYLDDDADRLWLVKATERY